MLVSGVVKGRWTAYVIDPYPMSISRSTRYSHTGGSGDGSVEMAWDLGVLSVSGTMQLSQ